MRRAVEGGVITKAIPAAALIDRRVRRTVVSRILFALIAVGLFLPAGAAQARSLYWDSVDVKAHVNADGSMNVTERQAIVFDGAWNGGERRFDLGLGQQVHLLALRRIDPVSGQSVNLVKGALGAVDHYKWVKRNVLRWRSRLPGDAPFHHTRLVYEIEYRLSDVLLAEGRNCTLDHDFAFRNRPGEIRHFTLDFSVDPAWALPPGFSGQQVREHLMPHQGVIGRFTLVYRGPGQPAAVLRGAAPRWLALLAALFLVLLAWRVFVCVRSERRSGRLAPPPDPASIDEEWLQHEVFNLLPEQVGAQWDDRTGAAEVAAILARLVQEGRLESHVEQRGWWFFRRQVLELKLLQARDRFKGYEGKLVKSLFIDGDTTDTARVRKYYRKKRTPFDPASKIKAALDRKPSELIAGKRALRGGWILTFVFALAGAAAFASLLHGELDWLALVMPFLAFGIANAVSIRVLAVRARDEVDRPWLYLALAALAWLLFVLVLIALFAWFHRYVPLAAWTGVMFIELAIANSTLNSARTRETPERIARRKRLCAARRYFAVELRRPRPRLKDSWFPYLIAFGLGAGMDRWFRAFGTGGGSGGLSSFGGGSGMAGSWTGGGGCFGGGGAAGSWASAAGSLSDGVSSSSSGGGFSGGGGGGGGGGGW